MAHLLIWGDTREILAGGLPAGSPVAEVRSLADLKAVVDGRTPALVLADPRRLDAEKDAVEAWLRAGAKAHVVLLAVADAREGEELRRRLPFVDDLLPRPVTPECLLERTAEAFHGRRQAERALRRKHDDLAELNNIGIALSAERNIDTLLAQILSKSREITAADAGSLYLVERAQDTGEGAGDRLRFKLAQNDSMDVPFEEKLMALDVTSIAGYVALAGEPLDLADAYDLPPGAPYKIDRSKDETSGYRSKSMLTVPMRDHKGIVIGVVQLINKKRGRSVRLGSISQIEREVIPFTTVDVDLARSLTSQAAVAFENAELIERIQNLFEQFIHGAVAAIELRDPTTAGHSERVAILSVDLVEKVNAASTGPLAHVHFVTEQVKELRYAALLHDFGKVGVEEKVLKKEKKVHATQKIAIRQRFAYILKAIEAEALQARLQALQSGRAGADELAAIDARYARRRTEAERVLKAVLAANEPTVVEEETFNALVGMTGRSFANHEEENRFPVESWADGPFLRDKEIEVLSVRRGSLSESERKAIQSHVQTTYEFLQMMPWTSDLRRIPEIAWAHHEKLDGSGYPRGLRGPENIPIESRIMTIADIFDALVAWDRPYKQSVSVERALGILDEEAADGKLDRELLSLFLEAKVYDSAGFKARLRPKGQRL